MSFQLQIWVPKLIWGSFRLCLGINYIGVNGFMPLNIRSIISSNHFNVFLRSCAAFTNWEGVQMSGLRVFCLQHVQHWWKPAQSYSLDAFCHAQYSQDHFTEFLHCRSTSSSAWSTAETSFKAYCARILLQSRAHSHSSHCAICSGVVMAKKVSRTDCWDTLQGRVCRLHFERFFGTFWGLQSMAIRQVRTRYHQDGCTGLGIPRFLALASCCRPISFGFFTPCVAVPCITGSPVAVLMASTVTSHTPSIATINILTVCCTYVLYAYFVLRVPGDSMSCCWSDGGRLLCLGCGKQFPKLQ